jgi:hypothetical protein
MFADSGDAPPDFADDGDFGTGARADSSESLGGAARDRFDPGGRDDPSGAGDFGAGLGADGAGGVGPPP